MKIAGSQICYKVPKASWIGSQSRISWLHDLSFLCHGALGQVPLRVSRHRHATLVRKGEVAHSAPHGTERGYSLKILCVRSHVSDREFIQFTAEA